LTTALAVLLLPSSKIWMLPERGSGTFGCCCADKTVKFIDPDPVTVPPATLTQSSAWLSSSAFHLQPGLLVVTVKVPLPPFGPNVLGCVPLV